MRFPLPTQLALTAGLLAASLIGCSGPKDAPLPADQKASIDDIVQATKTAHGIEAWDKADSLKADMAVTFGGNKMVDGTFTFQAHGPKARYDMADGTVVVFDGKTAWITPADKADPMARFHVLTWPWFLMAPFKVQGEGIELSELGTQTIRGQEYISILQEFADGTGDTPDDWYRLFIDPRNDRLHGMSYIVTYGKDREEAEKQTSIVLHENFTDVAGAQIPSEFAFWYWDDNAGTFQGDQPKGTATATNLEFVTPGENFYAKPEGAVEIALPQAAQAQAPAESSAS